MNSHPLSLQRFSEVGGSREWARLCRPSYKAGEALARMAGRKLRDLHHPAHIPSCIRILPFLHAQLSTTHPTSAPCIFPIYFPTILYTSCAHVLHPVLHSCTSQNELSPAVSSPLHVILHSWRWLAWQAGSWAIRSHNRHSQIARCTRCLPSMLHKNMLNWNYEIMKL